MDVSYGSLVRGATVRIYSGLVSSEDRLLFTNQNGISGSYDSATGVLTLSGSASGTTYATALKSVKYSNIAANPSNGDRSFIVQVGTATYSTATGHYYEYIPASNITWTNARNDASSRSSLGLTGYLATITSTAEQSFVYSTFGGTNAWLGGADFSVQNTWRWLTGPEGTQNGGTGVPFYVNGVASGGAYTNWGSGYPINASSYDYLMMFPSGLWYSVINVQSGGGYIIEYGGLGTTPTFNDRWLGTIHVLDRTDSPIVTSPTSATLVNSSAFTITGTAPPASLVQVFVDADNNGVADTPGSAVASQQLSGGVFVFSISTPLTQDVANNFVVTATAYAGANPSFAIDVPTITDNAPPTVASNLGAVSTSEGSAATNSGTFSDLQGNATVILSASSGTVTQNNASGTWSWSRNTTDGPSGPTTIVLTATDNFGVATQSTFTYTVNNVAPAISLSGATTVNEGSPYTLLLGAVTDPGTDTITSYSINWGDGVTENFTGLPSGNSKTHIYPDGPFNRTYGVSVTDEDGTFLAGEMSIQVLNVAPTATLVSNGPVTYGQTATFVFSNQHDDSVTDTTAGFHYAFSTTAGTSGGFSGATYATSNAAPYLDVTGLTAGDHTYYARIIDKDDGFNEYSLTVTVNKATLMITADPQSKTYDGTTAASVTLSDNRVAGDSLTVAYTSATFDDKNVGTGKLVTVSGVSISGQEAVNYDVAPTASTTANITARTLTVTASADTKTYDGNTSATVTLEDDRVGDDALVLGYASADFDDRNAGSDKTVTVSGITVSGIDATNYSLVIPTAFAVGSINRRNLSAIATASNKVYDGTTAASVSLDDNRVPGDTFSLTFASAVFDDAHVGTEKNVTISGLAISGQDAANYWLPQSTVLVTADIQQASPSFVNLATSYAVVAGASSVTISGQIVSQSVPPPGSVTMVINGISQVAEISSTDGEFSVEFPTSSLTVSGSPYTVALSYSASANGTPDFVDTSSSRSLTVNARAFTVVTSYTTTVFTGLGTGTINLVDFDDPNALSNPTTYTATIDWGDGVVQTGVSVAHTAADGTTVRVFGSHAYAASGLFQPIVTLYDANGSVITTNTANTATIHSGTDVSNKVSITRSGLIRNRATGLYYSTVTVNNISTTALTGDLDLVLTNLTPGATLTNADGTSGENSWVRIKAGTLAAGAKVSFQLAFSLPANVSSINFNTKIYLL